MQQYLSTPQGRQLISPALQSLLPSMIDASTGFAVDPTLFQQYLGEFSSEGIPTGWSGDSPFRDAKDLRILGDLMSNIDPKTGLSLLQDSNLLNGEIGSGLFGKIPPGFGGLGGRSGICAEKSR